MLTRQDSRYIDRVMGYKPMFSATLEHMCDIHYTIMEEVADSLDEWQHMFGLSVAKKVLSQLGYANNEISDGVRHHKERKLEERLSVAEMTFNQLLHDIGIEHEFETYNVEYVIEEEEE